ncbi:pyridoxal phosphate-dependent transferase [Rhypophila decipiens]|uniref:Pyridoxal phosphate-dependent transferase n=1 Tax=Rhypophila decipiens TaxID=261697 RepID=A0AAN6YCL8_9PEZI|nr:pyridoxal phosphate-dependent transferase [Rhypophila decipiens]
MATHTPSWTEEKGTPTGALLYPHTKTYMIFGANTDVGKTVVSTVLCLATRRTPEVIDEVVYYLKPVSTGPATESDESYVRKYTNGIRTKTFYQWDKAVSPHIAARESTQRPPRDVEVLRQIICCAEQCDNARGSVGEKDEGWLFVETAGGVLSPGPSGTSQADMYRPLRMPVILVGDSKMGGISTTISAFESLRIRGYDVSVVVLVDFHPEYQNADYLKEYFTKYSVPVHTLPPPPSSDREDFEEKVQAYYEEIRETPDSWYELKRILRNAHLHRTQRLLTMRPGALKRLWYPFTQHGTLVQKNIMVIDSALGDHFQTVVLEEPGKTDDDDRYPRDVMPEDRSRGVMQSFFDGSASWWTQGLGHGNSYLALEAAYASGRYGHVIFPEAIHEPALKLAEALMAKINNPRVSRVFFSDNGSTGVEVALKMALHAVRARFRLPTDTKLWILGLRDSYHGDTMGAMDCSMPSAFNQQIEWYTPRGVWLDYPKVFCRRGRWFISIPPSIKAHSTAEFTRGPFPDLDTLFGIAAKRATHDEDKTLYETYIARILFESQKKGIHFGALMLEPVVLGANGMHLVDPLFQRTLVEHIRNFPHLVFPAGPSRETPHSTWSGLPVIFDEVFTGMFRLGRVTASSFLDVHPDISVHAKLLTGGLLPLCVTLASESIFNAFSGNQKTDALLHGHSYTAHPIGCHVANVSLERMWQMYEGGEWNWAIWTGKFGKATRQNSWSFWPRDFVHSLSQLIVVAEVWALGCVLAVHLSGPAGYTSAQAYRFQVALRSRDKDKDWNIHTRPLGNVLYIMTSLTTTHETMTLVAERLLDVLTS